MRYFKESGGNRWMWDGEIMWLGTKVKSPEELSDSTLNTTETDAAGNPLPKYRYFRYAKYDNAEWRTDGNSWEHKGILGSGWTASCVRAVEDLEPGSYECDEWGSPLGVKGFDLPEGTKIIPCGSPEAVAADNATPSTAPMSEEERFRWQFAGQAPEMPEWFPRTCPDMQSMSAKDALEHSNADALWRVTWAEALIAALEKPKEAK